MAEDTDAVVASLQRQSNVEEEGESQIFNNDKISN